MAKTDPRNIPRNRPSKQTTKQTLEFKLREVELCETDPRNIPRNRPAKQTPEANFPSRTPHFETPPDKKGILIKLNQIFYDVLVWRRLCQCTWFHHVPCGYVYFFCVCNLDDLKCLKSCTCNIILFHKKNGVFHRFHGFSTSFCLLKETSCLINQLLTRRIVAAPTRSLALWCLWVAVFLGGQVWTCMCERLERGV